MGSFPLHAVIATHERPSLLERTLESLAQCERPEAYQETLVVENGSKAGTEDVVHAFEDTLNARYLYTPRGNKSHALNLALQEIDEGLIYFTDDDVRLHPSVLKRFAEAAQQKGRHTFFGGPTDVDYEEEPPDWLVPHLPGSATGWALNKADQEVDQLFIGFNWAAFRSDIVSVGGFNPLYGPGSPSEAVGQETELQERLAMAGMKQSFVPGAKVWHYVPKSRCTPQWTLRRKYREGLKIGVSIGRQELTLLGIPGWLSRFCSTVGQSVGDLLRGRSTNVFGALVDLCHHAGILSGHWWKLYNGRGGIQNE
jgi:GT2 family glycosyltransferase